MASKSTRRDFIKGSAAAGAGFWIGSRFAWSADSPTNSPNEKLSVACIGVGGKGDSDSDQVAKHANLIAICDIDENTLNKKAEKFPKAKKFSDYRKMFDEMGKDIDLVTVSIPDHNHAAASMLAIEAGKGVYCQKPMTHNVLEARKVRESAKAKGVATQLGNQGTAGTKFREGVEALRAGAVGDVTEVHVWTNRPIWPQAPFVTALPTDTPPTPKNVAWNTWIGPAPYRPWAVMKYERGGKEHTATYHPFNWRGWWDFGTGALGDMGCHTANLPYMALKLGYPTSVVAECGDLNEQTYPSWATIHYEFPEREGMPAVKLTWWEGHKDKEFKIRNLPPVELFQGQKIRDSGSLVIGKKGSFYSPSDYGGEWELLPKELAASFKAPPPSLPRNPRGDDEGQKMEWVHAAREGKPELAMANFNYGGMLTEFLLLGNVAIRMSGQAPGKVLQWDGPGMKFSNAPEADKLLEYKYREGWTL